MSAGSVSRSREPRTCYGKIYMPVKKIGSGSFGVIYLGKDLKNGGEVAIKLESRRARHPQLQQETHLYRLLSGGAGIPNVRWYGNDNEYNILVMDLLGPSLEDLHEYLNRHFSLKTVLMLVEQLITRFEFIHSRRLIHRDVKPNNILMGIGENVGEVNIIDFGLSKRFIDVKTGKHIRYKEGKNLTGTARYASVNTHIGVEQSRRDDMESLGYVMIYLLLGSLPWQGLKANTKKQKYNKIRDKKIMTSIDELCMGLPPEFGEYIRYTRGLKFDEKPQYTYMRGLFRDLFVREGFVYDYVYDWTPVSSSKKRADRTPKLSALSGLQSRDSRTPGLSRPREERESAYMRSSTAIDSRQVEATPAAPAAGSGAGGNTPDEGAGVTGTTTTTADVAPPPSSSNDRQSATNNNNTSAGGNSALLTSPIGGNLRGSSMAVLGSPSLTPLPRNNTPLSRNSASSRDASDRKRRRTGEPVSWRNSTASPSRTSASRGMLAPGFRSSALDSRSGRVDSTGGGGGGGTASFGGPEASPSSGGTAPRLRGRRLPL